MGEAGDCQNNTYNVPKMQVNDGWGDFQMPLHYPRYKKSDYETMPEWQLEHLLMEYGLPVMGDIDYKRNFAMGAFIWPSPPNE